MGGADHPIQGPSLAVGQMGDARSVSDSSLLQIFVRAKKKINDIFRETEDYIRDTVTYMQSVQQGSIVKSDDAVQVESYIAKVRAIRNVLTRNHMKVAFFGRTSNGKTSVINAMLHEEILPSGIGHTTNCFLQVEGSDSGEPYLVTEGSTEKQNVKSVEQLAHALCEENLGESQLVHIYWPKDKCLLLRNDVVFVDSPGTDLSHNLDEWIGRYCLDADAFVLVANAESTLTLVEKNFFYEVSTRLSKPNIFILYNRWDASGSLPHLCDKHRNEQSEVRAQHMEQAVKFLVTELDACTQQEAKERIFFVSAKEALQARLQEEKGLRVDSGALADGFPNRYFEFQDFERKFEECISKSAVRTKFEQHSRRGKDIVSEIQQIMDSTYDQAQQLKTQKAVAKKEIHDKLKSTEQQLLRLTQEMNGKIRQMVEDVKQKVSKALSEEIDCLSVLVDKFNLPFNTEQYKKDLHHHVTGLHNKLHAKLCTALAKNTENIQQEMTERMSGLLAAEKKQVSLNALPRRKPFDTFCADFYKDLESECSWGIMQTFASTSRNITAETSTSDQTKNCAAFATGAGTAAVIGTATVTGTLAAPLAIGAAAAGLIYGIGKYIYDEIKSTNEERERKFKEQYVAHVTNKLRVLVNSKSTSCSKQVQQELSSTFARLRDLVDAAINDMDAEIKSLDKEIKQLEEAANSAKVLWNKANYITKQLAIFDDEFLKLHN